MPRGPSSTAAARGQPGRTACPSCPGVATCCATRAGSPCRAATRPFPPWRSLPAVSAGLGRPIGDHRGRRVRHSGAGQAPEATPRRRRGDGLRHAYAVGASTGIPPRSSRTSRRYDGPSRVSFTPVLAPMSRGILATVTAPLTAGVTRRTSAPRTSRLCKEQFVHLLPEGWPHEGERSGSNAVHLQAAVTHGRAAGRGWRDRQPDQGHGRRRGPVHEPRARARRGQGLTTVGLSARDRRRDAGVAAARPRRKSSARGSCGSTQARPCPGWVWHGGRRSCR